MKYDSRPAIQLKINGRDQLQSLNEVLLQITDLKEHRYWCSEGLPFRQAISEFPVNDKPVFCWSATSKQGAVVGHMELHNNQFGWVIARVWVHPDYRRQGLARAMYLNTLSFASGFTNQVGAFCYHLNEASKNLLLDLGFTCIESGSEQAVAFFVSQASSIKTI